MFFILGIQLNLQAEIIIDLLQDPYDIGKLLLHILQELQLCTRTVQILTGIVDLVIRISVDMIHQEADTVLRGDD